MSTIRMALQEICRRKISFVLATVAVVTAVVTMLNVNAALVLYNARAEDSLAAMETDLQARLKTLQDEMRKATLKLSFNLVILPAAQETREWHEQDYSSSYMPEDYVQRMAHSRLLSVRHFLPTLSQKVTWPEMKRTVYLVGCRGEVPNLAKRPRTPLVQPVPDGKMIVGYELQQSLGLREGQRVHLMGREFTIDRCYAERGSKDDIGVWIPLQDAQELLGKPGQINAIMALECVCVGNSAVDKIRAEIAKVLPDTKVIELGTKVLARSEARAEVGQEAVRAVEQEKRRQQELMRERRRLAALLNPSVVVGCGVWILFLSLINTRQRKSEVAILRVVGCRSIQILLLFLSRAAVVGIVGASLGGGLGLLGTWLLRGDIEVPLFGPAGMLPWTFVFACPAIGALLGVVAGWIPALLAARQDPAIILKDS
jgi:ABC-type lipoprotein release transport system permease subunit